MSLSVVLTRGSQYWTQLRGGEEDRGKETCMAEGMLEYFSIKWKTQPDTAMHDSVRESEARESETHQCEAQGTLDLDRIESGEKFLNSGDSLLECACKHTLHGRNGRSPSLRAVQLQLQWMRKRRQSLSSLNWGDLPQTQKRRRHGTPTARLSEMQKHRSPSFVESTVAAEALANRPLEVGTAAFPNPTDFSNVISYY
jgi:hypothetical protein